ncbi:PH domain-containing protein [Embleya sp. NPDC055664]
MDTLEYRITPRRREWIAAAVAAGVGIAAALWVTVDPGWAHFLRRSVAGDVSRWYIPIWMGLVVLVLVPPLMVRGVVARTRLTPEGITDRGLFRTRFVPWAEVTDLSIRAIAPNYLTRRIRVRRRHGRPVYLSGVQDRVAADGLAGPCAAMVGYWREALDPHPAAHHR